jgi:hypothetical protein
MESSVDQECGMCVRDGTIDVLSHVKKEDDNGGAASEELEAPQDEDEDEDEDEDSTSQEGF